MLVFPLFLAAQAGQGNDLTQLKVDVVYLSSDLLEGRSTGTTGELLAAEYIAARMKEIGLSPLGDDGTFYQVFDFELKANPHSDKPGRSGQGRNVVGFLDNGADITTVIGAHYDHLGHGDFGSLYTGEPAIHNGADDNASGVAAMLRLAEQLKATEGMDQNFLFLAFSGEEMGLYGSKFFAGNPTIELEKINCMLNMDMVGRLNDEKVLAVNGAGTSPSWKEAFDRIETDLQLKTSDSGVGPSDHTSFYLKDIPVLHFFTGQHSDYHKPSDDSELVNYEGIDLVADFIFELVKSIDPNGELAFTKTKDESQDRQAASFKVTLGVMPDYVFAGEGMRIDGVLDDRPAQKAGLESGDVVIKLGDVEVKDIYDYMKGLSKFKKGQTTTVVVKREDKVLVRDVTF